jgi:hypothetical protein
MTHTIWVQYQGKTKRYSNLLQIVNFIWYWRYMLLFLFYIRNIKALLPKKKNLLAKWHVRISYYWPTDLSIHKRYGQSFCVSSVIKYLTHDLEIRNSVWQIANPSDIFNGLSHEYTRTIGTIHSSSTNQPSCLSTVALLYTYHDGMQSQQLKLMSKLYLWAGLNALDETTILHTGNRTRHVQTIAIPTSEIRGNHYSDI